MDAAKTLVMETSGSEQIPNAVGSGSGGESLPKHTMIGEFEIVGTIGEGGFGTVYLAIDHSLQRKVALKEYRPALLATRHGKSVMVRSQRHADAFEAGLKSFMNEARTLARFDHPALIHVYRVWQQNNTAYMAMPLCEGKSLTMLIRDNPAIATQEWVTAMMLPLLEAVSTLHSSNIFHRDIAPDNVLIQDNGLPMLLDFGAARQIATDKTQALTVILKPGYAPIEQFADDSSMKQGPWTDIYALGAVMYFTITGRAPPNAVARLAGDSLAPLTQTIPDGYPQEFLDAIDKALEIRPKDRPQSIAEFRSLLERVPSAVIPRAAAPDERSVASTSAVGSGPITVSPVTVSPARDASRMMLEPMQRSAPETAAPPAAPATPATPKVALGARLRVAVEGATRTASKLAQSTRTRAEPLIQSRRGMQTVVATAAAILILVATVFVPNPFAPKSTNVETESAGTSSASGSAVAASASAAAPAALGSIAPTLASAGSNAAVIDALSQSPNVPPTSTPATAVPASILTAQVAAPAPIADPAPSTGTLSFAVRPWGEVFVDGESKGASPPLKRLTLKEGTYKIEVNNPGFPAFTSEVQVTRNKSITITHQFK